MKNQTYSAQTIRDYLLGQLPESETEQLDELSITDEECAERLRAVEHDLADAFARGELHGSELEQFRSRYLPTPRGRDAVRFAEALQSRGAAREPAAIREKRYWGPLALAAAVVLLATASAWLALDNRTLRARVTTAESARDQLQRDRPLREADAPRPADAVAPPEPASLTVATMVLTPQLRSARQLPAVALAGSAGDLAVQLDLEPVDYPAYAVTLLASAGGRPLWQTDRLIARTVGSRKTIDLRLPAAMLSPQDYLIRVSGVPARGAAEIVGEYRFTVVR